MAEAKKEEKDGQEVKTGFQVVEFTKEHGSRKKGEKETYHKSTADALVNKLKVAKVVEELTKWEPKKAEK
jgi:hypothetical protein